MDKIFEEQTLIVGKGNGIFTFPPRESHSGDGNISVVMIKSEQRALVPSDQIRRRAA